MFNPDSETEKFVIHHNDLDLQNILTDGNGNVTEIFDWDGAFVGPRCIGPTVVPVLLRRDWYPNECGSYLKRAPHMAFNYGYYHHLYAAVIRKTVKDQGMPDRPFQCTAKSALYQATIAAIYEGGHPLDLSSKVLRRIPIGMHPYSDMKLLGRG